LAFGRIARWDEVVKQSLDARFISAPPTPDQVKDLVDIVYTAGK